MAAFVDDKGEDRLRAVSFAAGTAAFMACIERAFMVSVFMHWRIWAFLAFNLLLLAILFTSKPQIESKKSDCKVGADAEHFKKSSSKKKRHHHHHHITVVPTAEVTAVPPAVGQETESGEKEEGKLGTYDELSEEELKQRVEDFIAMFRQHLICDAKDAKIMG